MKKIIIALIVVTILYLSFVQRVTVEEGMEAVIIKKPWFIKPSGIESKAYSTGTIWAVNSTEIKLLTLKPFEINETFTNLLSSDNIPLSFTLNMIFQYQKNKTPLLIKKFGDNNQWYSNFILPTIKVSIESAVRSNLFENLQANNTSIQTIEESTNREIKNILNEYQIPVNLIQLHINQIIIPKTLTDAAIKRELLKEEIKIKKEEIKIQNLRKKLEETTAHADKAYMLKMNMSVNQYLKMKKLELEKTKIVNQRYIIDQAKESNGTFDLNINIGK